MNLAVLDLIARGTSKMRMPEKIMNNENGMAGGRSNQRALWGRDVPNENWPALLDPFSSIVPCE